MEIWKSIDEFSNYEISSYGRIRKKFCKKELHPSDNGNGYLRICLYDDNGNRKYQYIHRLVLLNFKGKPKNSDMVTNHIDENRKNNHVENLEWMTLVDNFQYGTSISRNARSRYKPVVLLEYNKIYKNAEEAAKENNLKKENITAACNGKLITCGGYHWKYYREKDYCKYPAKNNECKRKVKCLDSNMIFDSITDAANYYGLNRKNIGSCCSGKRKSCGGLHWEYVGEINEIK